MPLLSDSTGFWGGFQTLYLKPFQTYFLLFIFLLYFRPKNPANSFSTICFFTKTMAPFNFKTKTMPEQKTLLLNDGVESMQTDPIY